MSRASRPRNAWQSPEEQTAYHEAGHAVVASVLRLGLTHISIVNDPEQNRLGVCAQGEGEVDPFPTTAAGAQRLLWHSQKQMVFAWAGLAAESIHTGTNPRQGKSQDENRIACLADEIDCYDDDERGVFIEWTWYRARGILKSQWPCVEALAEALLRHKELTGRRARAILRRAARAAEGI